MRMYNPDDTVYCETCGSPLKYDRFNKRWDAIELYPDHRKCWKPKAEQYDHVPKANVSRLLKAAKRWNERKHHVD
jgi:hypothetical protein